jgi:hypothetical protein
MLIPNNLTEEQIKELEDALEKDKQIEIQLYFPKSIVYEDESAKTSDY